ncbi:MAG: response regulator [Bacilli bacterium]|nr:response regulator [Bacilli bacterium]
MKNKNHSKAFNILIIVLNFFIVIGVFISAILYTNSSDQKTRESRYEGFANANLTLSQVTTSYLEGERSVVASWAKHLNTTPLSINEAINYVQSAKSVGEAVGHVLYVDTLKGYSTFNDQITEVDYSGLAEYFDIVTDRTVKISRAHENPTSGITTIDFFSSIKVIDPLDNTKTVDAYVVRAMPTSLFKEKWTLSDVQYKTLEVALIGNRGNYVIHDADFENTNFYDFYELSDEHNDMSHDDLVKLIRDHHGYLFMYDAHGNKILVAYAAVENTDHWTMLSGVKLSEIDYVPFDWLLIAIISAGLLILLAVDMTMFILYNKRLRIAVNEAERANKAKTDFLSTMSHDIRTPMNAIVGLTTIAARQIEHQEIVIDCLKKIDLSSNHLLTLINDILDISKVESGKISINPITFSISEVLENLVNISHPMVKAKNLEFNFRVHDFDHEYIYSDKLRLNQIFINILSNAIKYTPEKGRIDADIFEKPIEKEGHLKFVYRIADTGIGMSEDFMKRMYEAFARETDSRVNAIQGTGLGLAITKRMVEMLGGTIECESALGKGTTFTVSIDVEIADKPVEEMVLPPMKILFADDDEILLTTAKNTLEGLGARIETATSGQEALNMVVDNHQTDDRYKVVILDWKMPDIDGLEVARLIKQKIDHDIPIIMVSSYDWSDIEESAKEIGIDGFIYKPLFKSKVYEQIATALNLEREKKETVEEATDLVGLNVLVVEDNDINWEIISALLQMNGVVSFHAENGAVAVNLIKEHEQDFDLIFMDIQMPVLNGLEATKQIRQLDSDYARNIPIIAMTADAFSENIAECLKVGMNGHIAKPIDMNLVIKELIKVKESKNK